ncbi:iron complex outermembrane recepter protein [Caldimonas brevitalea]|uniref:Iron complex outermembrane recepter protein n=1 Tax=Caldimonas brevitalea TaxID=413882 RepID=A0A0G3BF71_9BURK|nr:iron complex outermembrane recepter protein [Caldimonas brevitalea]
MQKVEITGSAVRRIQGETALPVQVINRQEIERTGATSTAELIQSLPSMQTFTNEATSVGGGGNGFSGASIHGLGEDKTLVLLNGRRVATFAGQELTGELAGVDLNVIPLAAIERIEVLTDGASALYGADAVGGVINFITKKDSTEGNFMFGASLPKDGGREGRVGISKGIGNYDEDGYNFLFAASYDQRNALRSVDRDFARTGIVNFSQGGKRYRLFNGSASSIPANLATDDGQFYNPYLRNTGSCAKKSVEVDGACYYDYVQDLEIVPERERGSVFLSGAKALGSDKRLYAEALLSNTVSTSRIAPPPGAIVIDPGVFPEAPEGGTAFYRVAAVGPRATETVSKARHFVIGSDGTLGRFDYDISYTRSVNKYQENMKSGWMSQTAADAALNAVNPFTPLDQLPPGELAVLRDAQVTGFFLGGESTLDNLQTRASTEVAKLPGGALSVAAGVNYLRDQFERTGSDLAQGIGDTRFGDTSALVPYSASRHAWGAFGEVVAPVSKQVELGAGLRHDRYSDMGGATTAKGTIRWQPASGVLLRASLGTGFKAATVAQLNAKRQYFGVTAGRYNCGANPELSAIAASLGAECRPGAQQHDQIAEGSKDLEPEKSKQWTIGFRLEPTSSFSFGADLWNVKLRHQIDQVDEDVVFANPNEWRHKFTTFYDPGARTTYLAFLANNDNLGEREERGIDFDVQGSARLSFGKVTSKLIATYMLKDSYQLLEGGESYTSLGRYGEDGEVIFRWIGRWINTLEMGDFNHTLALNFKSGFTDQTYTADDGAVEEIGPSGESLGYVDMVRKVKHYITLDWQTTWAVNKQFKVVGGILNLLNEDPPLSIKTSGGGHMIGYDDRYYDARGRTLYLNASYTF